jgi:CTD small phosphatase-like protein 2
MTRLSKKHDVKIGIRFDNGTVIEAGVNIRPYAKEILRNLHKDFEIFVFTASQACYAD